MANVRDICTKKTVVATPETTVAAAAQLMRRNHVGTIVVCERKGKGAAEMPVGIVTDRDIVVEVVAPDLRADTITVGDIMDRRLVTVRENESVLEALSLMRHNGVRRLPVTGKDGRLRGLVSIDDLMRVLPGELIDISLIARRGQAREAATRR
jgi:CBS domain-containing protein